MLRKLPSFLKSSPSATVASAAAAPEPASDTTEHRLAPVDSTAQDCAPVGSGADNCAPLVLGSIRSATEHAEMLVEIIRQHGLCDRALYQGDLQRLHGDACEDLAWQPKGWPAVCRELAKLPGVRRGQVKVEGQRLTVYEIEPAAEPTNVVELTERREAS